MADKDDPISHSPDITESTCPTHTVRPLAALKAGTQALPSQQSTLNTFLQEDECTMKRNVSMLLPLPLPHHLLQPQSCQMIVIPYQILCSRGRTTPESFKIQLRRMSMRVLMENSEGEHENAHVNPNPHKASTYSLLLLQFAYTT